MFDMVNRLLWCIPISNSAEKTTSIGNVLSQFTSDRLSSTRKIFIFTITKEQIHIQIRNAKLKEKVLLQFLTVIFIQRTFKNKVLYSLYITTNTFRTFTKYGMLSTNGLKVWRNLPDSEMSQRCCHLDTIDFFAEFLMS